MNESLEDISLAAESYYRMHRRFADEIEQAEDALQYLKEEEPKNTFGLLFFAAEKYESETLYAANVKYARDHKDAHLDQYIELAKLAMSEEVQNA